MNRTLNLLTALLLVVLVVLVTLPSIVLGPEDVFGFPDVLRQPAEVALSRLNENVGIIRPMYYLFAWSSILIIPLAVMLHDVLRRGRPASTLLNISTVFGVLAGVVQVLGFIRWSFMKPALAERVFDPNASEATREAGRLIYHAFNEYAGIGIGEHLGFLFVGLWLLLAGLYIAFNVRFGRFSPWLGWSVIVMSILIMISTAEQFGIDTPLVETAFFVGYGGSIFWLLFLAAALVFERRPQMEPALA